MNNLKMDPKDIAYWFILLMIQLSSKLDICSATFDINDLQLQMVADSLKVDECRKLSESLHENGFEPHRLITGGSEPNGVSCLRLLHHWNTHEGRGQSFHLLELRLKQLGRHDIADQLSLSVSDEKVNEVRETFLDDPFRSKIRPDSEKVPQPDDGLISGVSSEAASDSRWTGSEIFQVVLFFALALVFLFFTVLTLVRIFLPDSFARMRVSLYQTFVGKRPGDEELFFVM